MKRQRSSTKEALISRFIQNHYNGDALKKFMDMSPRLDENDLHFLRVLTSNESAFNQRLNDQREAIDVILDVKSARRSFSEIIPVLQGYAEGNSSLTRESIALITANICARAVEDNVLTSGRKCPLMLELNTYKELADLTSVVKKLVAVNKFKIDSFKQKYFEMGVIPLQVLWHFHHTDLVMFTSYIYHNASQKEVIDHIKSSMVELLSSLSGVACSDAEDRSSLTNEHMMDVGEIVRTSTHQKNAENYEMKDNEEDSLLQLKQDMAKDLVSLLLCVAQVPGPSTSSFKYFDMLENVIKRVMDRLLAASLNSTEEVEVLDGHKNFLSLLLSVPTLSVNLLEPFLISHLVNALTYKPYVDARTAISKQSYWTLKKSPAILTSVIGSMLDGLQMESLEVMKDILQKGEMNWRLVLVCVSTYLKCVPEGGRHMKARQCCAEGCAPWFTSYVSWFGTTFGHESLWASQQMFEFFIHFLTNMVPYEPPACLKVHINKPPASPPSGLILLRDYISLAKTRLTDLNEVPGFGLFGLEFTTEEDIEHALKHFETHDGEIAQTVLNASLFRRQHFEQEFLGKLLAPRIIPDTLDIKAKFITKLHTMGKISHSAYSRYQEACLADASIYQGPSFICTVHSAEVFNP